MKISERAGVVQHGDRDRHGVHHHDTRGHRHTILVIHAAGVRIVVGHGGAGGADRGFRVHRAAEAQIAVQNAARRGGRRAGRIADVRPVAEIRRGMRHIPSAGIHEDTAGIHRADDGLRSGRDAEKLVGGRIEGAQRCGAARARQRGGIHRGADGAEGRPDAAEHVVVQDGVSSGEIELVGHRHREVAHRGVVRIGVQIGHFRHRGDRAAAEHDLLQIIAAVRHEMRRSIEEAEVLNHHRGADLAQICVYTRAERETAQTRASGSVHHVENVAGNRIHGHCGEIPCRSGMGGDDGVSAGGRINGVDALVRIGDGAHRSDNHGDGGGGRATGLILSTRGEGVAALCRRRAAEHPAGAEVHARRQRACLRPGDGAKSTAGGEGGAGIRAIREPAGQRRRGHRDRLAVHRDRIVLHLAFQRPGAAESGRCRALRRADAQVTGAWRDAERRCEREIQVGGAGAGHGLHRERLPGVRQIAIAIPICPHADTARSIDQIRRRTDRDRHGERGGGADGERGHRQILIITDTVVTGGGGVGRIRRFGVRGSGGGDADAQIGAGGLRGCAKDGVVTKVERRHSACEAKTVHFGRIPARARAREGDRHPHLGRRGRRGRQRERFERRHGGEGPGGLQIVGDVARERGVAGNRRVCGGQILHADTAGVQRRLMQAVHKGQRMRIARGDGRILEHAAAGALVRGDVAEMVVIQQRGAAVIGLRHGRAADERPAGRTDELVCG